MEVVGAKQEPLGELHFLWSNGMRKCHQVKTAETATKTL